jgi:hypothetical protein
MDNSKTRAAPRRWRQWREADARGALAEWETSGMGLDEFARSKGVSPSRLRNWKRRLDPSEPVRFVSVARTNAPAATIEIEVRGVVLRARQDVDEEHLCRIVSALAARLGPC